VKRATSLAYTLREKPGGAERPGTPIKYSDSSRASLATVRASHACVARTIGVGARRGEVDAGRPRKVGTAHDLASAAISAAMRVSGTIRTTAWMIRTTFVA
jgi:hypothetical protein